MTVFFFLTQEIHHFLFGFFVFIIIELNQIFFPVRYLSLIMIRSINSYGQITYVFLFSVSPIQNEFTVTNRRAHAYTHTHNNQLPCIFFFICITNCHCNMLNDAILLNTYISGIYYGYNFLFSRLYCLFCVCVCECVWYGNHQTTKAKNYETKQESS